MVGSARARACCRREHNEDLSDVKQKTGATPKTEKGGRLKRATKTLDDRHLEFGGEKEVAYNVGGLVLFHLPFNLGSMSA